MIRFCLWFLLTVPLIVLLVFLIPIGEERTYSMIGYGCLNRGHWLQKRLARKESIDIAFIGSSHAIHAVNEEVFAKHHGTAVKNVANLGHCRYGRDMQYLILRQLLEQHDPRLIIIEFREDEWYESHRDFSCFCKVSDLPDAVQFTNGETVVKETIGCRLRSVQRRFFNHPFHYGYSDELLGYRGREGTIDPEKALEELKKVYKINDARQMKELNSEQPFFYLKKMQELCKEHNAEIVFTYIPSYDGPNNPEHLDRLETMGRVALPPAALYSNPTNFFEFNHMNANTAEVYSSWLGKLLNPKGTNQE